MSSPYSSAIALISRSYSLIRSNVHSDPVEIGWRLARDHLRKGYAEEAARLSLAFGFGRLALSEIVAFTLPGNEPSWRLMEKLGMRPDGRFDHPRLGPDHPMREHLLYRIARTDWVTSRLG